LQHFLLPCDAYVVLISSLITSGKLAWWLLWSSFLQFFFFYSF
jgi:hypothetical protein